MPYTQRDKIEEQPLVSVILPTHNGARYVKRAIESVLNQTYKNVEVIVIDDGSTDETLEVILKLKERDSRIFILTNEANLSYVKSLNKGAKKVAGKYITRIDDDDIWCGKDRLEKQVRFLQEHPDYVLVGGGMIKIDENSKEVSRYLFPEKDEDIRKAILLSQSIAHGTVFFRRDSFEKVGGYDEHFGFFADSALSLSLGKLGKFYNFQEYFSYYFDKELSGNYNMRNLDIRRRVGASIKLIKKYRNYYPEYKKAYFFCWARYFYSFLPMRQKLLPVLLEIRTLIFGPPAYKYFESKK